MTTDVPVLCRREGRAGRLTLNRPQALHALNVTMCELMTAALLDWRDDASIELVVIDHSGDRGFCAGGDLRMMVESGRSDGAEARAFFHTEYRLNHLLHSFPKPVVALMDGVTMGGGVGISVHGSHRVATERTLFAMPETAIGFFPDVGGSWFLSRLPLETGTWLGLTGARIKGHDVTEIGVATHFVPSAELAEVKARLFSDGIGALENRTPAPPKLPHHEGGLVPLFQHDSIDAILAALDLAGSEWCTHQATTLRSRSRLSLEVTLHLLRLGRVFRSLAEALTIEYRLATRLIASDDFREGVRAVIIDKDNAAKWQTGPADLARLFAPISTEWSPLP